MKTRCRNCIPLSPVSAIAVAIVLLCGRTSFAEKPNFVITIADDHGVYHSSVYGAKEFQTPNLQQMAKEGIRFDNAYVASPACAPSRAALFTGRMPYSNGIVGNHEIELKPGVVSLLPTLLEQGYEVVFHGKVGHAGRKHFGQYVPEGVKILGGGGLQQTMTLDQVESFLEQRPEDAPPLALFLGWTDTHTAWPPKEEARIAPEDVVIPPKIFDTPETRVEMTRYVEGAEDIDRRVGQTQELIAKHLDVNNTLVVYTSDHGMPWPFAKWSLYETGIRTPLIAVWPGKIQPNSSTNAMVGWIDLIPTLIELAGGTSPSGIDGRSFAKVLFGETDKHRDVIFATHKGDNEKNVYPIRSVRVGKWKYIRNLHPEFAYTTHTDVWAKESPRLEGHWKHAGHHWQSYIDAAKTDPKAAAFLHDYHSNPAEELYNIESDPFEKHNLATSPAQAPKLAELRELVVKRMKQVDDDQSLSGPPQLLKDFSLPEITRNDTARSNKEGTERFVSQEKQDVARPQFRYPFELPAEIKAALNVDTTHRTSVNHMLLGLNCNWPENLYGKVGYNHRDAQRLITQLKPSSLRFPHGVWANFYDWESDGRRITDDYKTPYDSSVKKHPDLKYGFEGLHKLHQQLGFDVLLTFNVNYDSPEKAVRRLKDRQSKGFDVNWIELGNEPFWKTQRSDAIATVEKYIEVSKAHAAALRAAHPEVKLSIPVHWRTAETNPWNLAVKEHDYYDAVTLHKHMGYKPDQEGTALTLRAREHIVETGQTLRSIFPGKPIWVSEWSASCGPNALSVLAMADVYLGFFDHPELFAVADYFQINASHKHIEYDKATSAHTRTSNGAAYKIVRDVFEGGEIYKSSIESTRIGDGLNAVSAAAVVKDGKLILFAINKTTRPASFAFRVDGITKSQPVAHRALAFDSISSLKTFAMDEDVLTEVKPQGQQIVLPPLSINRIDVPTQL